MSAPTRGRGRPRPPPPAVNPSRVVRRPLPKTDSRKFQTAQLQRRFGCAGSNDNTQFTISLAPSDPDFPYDISRLEFVLEVPREYPSAADARPSIRVLNRDVPAGFKANIERGFDSLASGRGEATLLDLVKALDRNLEDFLKNEKAATLKLVPNNRPSNASPGREEPEPEPEPAVPSPPATGPSPNRAAAQKKRETELRQLEARLGSSPDFSKLADGVTYVVPLIPRKKELLPVPLQPIRRVYLVVPADYNLSPARVDFGRLGVPAELAATVQEAFARHVEENPNFSLMAHLNALASKLHMMAQGLTAPKKAAHVSGPAEGNGADVGGDVGKVDGQEPSAKQQEREEEKQQRPDEYLDKPHVQVVPRPPEWSFPNAGGEGADEDSSDESGSDGLTDGEAEGEESAGGAQREESSAASKVERAEHGTSLSYPGIQMFGIQLLEVLMLNVTVKCSRCKTPKDINSVKGTAPGEALQPRVESCNKCSNSLAVAFRKELIHASSHRIGFFDLIGCTVVDILPSDFIPECSECSTPLPAPGFKGLVVGQSTSANCRECHQKMTVFLPDVKLLRISENGSTIGSIAPKRVKEKEQRYVVGTELPNKGRCPHYKRSTRWFRFSCCSKVFPCDKCHDEQVEPRHFAEHANRMICGLCSREQNYRPEDCAFCGNRFFRRKTGWWEGGLGTRDRRLMRKNDPRKYKRVNKPL